jgi:XrtJ-associated TM-motif-TM protein
VEHDARQHDRQKFEVAMNLKKTLLALGFALIFAVALPLRAQTGCDDSPEDPTVMLALVGGAGALATMAWARVKARRNSPKR